MTMPIPNCTCDSNTGGALDGLWELTPADKRAPLCIFCQEYKDAAIEGSEPLYGSEIWKKVIVWLLYWLEVIYLRSSGWYRLPCDKGEDHEWRSPRNYPFQRKDPYTHGHAVNAQKQVDCNPRYRRLVDVSRKLARNPPAPGTRCPRCHRIAPRNDGIPCALCAPRKGLTS